jgi:hypothetical protein
VAPAAVGYSIVPSALMLAAARLAVASSGSGWITLTIALAGLTLSVVGLCWQAYTFTRSGSRVRVQTRLAIFITNERQPEESYLYFLNRVVDQDNTSLEDFDRLVVVAVIQNTGRLPVTIRNCQWHFKEGESEGWLSSGRLPYPSAKMPHRLDAHDECMSAMEYQLLIKTIHPRVRQIYPRVELANGRTAQGRSLEVPHPPENWKPFREIPPPF